jgi:drug/metabolite transporter (DMT)-like permease
MSDRGATPYVLMALAVVCVSVGSILVRLAQAPPLAVAFQRVSLAAAIVLPFAARDAAHSWPALPSRKRLLLVLAGVALALHFATWIASLSYTTVAASVLIVNTAPLFSLVFSRLFLAETPGPVVFRAGALAFVGAVLIAAGDWTGGAGSLLGILLALAGAVMLAAYHVTGRGLREALPLRAYILAVWGTAAVTLAVMTLVGGVPVYAYPPRTLFLFLLLALIPTLAGHGLVNRVLRDLPAPTVGLFMLGEPVGAALMAWALFGEVPAALTLAGGALILVALAWIVSAERRNQAAEGAK